MNPFAFPLLEERAGVFDFGSETIPAVDPRGRQSRSPSPKSGQKRRLSRQPSAEEHDDKKPKACLSCRKSKIKCVRVKGQDECARCIARGQDCTFVDKLSTGELAHVISENLESGLAHLARLTEAVGTLISELRDSGLPVSVNLPEYVPPSRAKRSKERAKEQTPAAPLQVAAKRATQPEPSFDNQPATNVGLDLPVTNLVGVTNSPRMFGLEEPSHLWAKPNSANLNPGDSNSANPSTDFMHDIFNFGSALRPQSTLAYPRLEDAPLGSEDARPNIIKKGIITNHTAKHLVSFFHDRLGRFLFGYHLGFGKIPYGPNGPPSITPFILSVLCLASSKRSTEYRQLVGPLHGEVSELLRQCTLTGSIFGFESLPVGLDAMGENWDPELGIGPEETVGCAILALFSDDRKDARITSATALKWAEGLIKWTKEGARTYTTIGEAVGLLQPPRNMNEGDMARLWLLCYIIDSTESIQGTDAKNEGSDPETACEQLSNEASGQHDDAQIVFHARIMRCLRIWRSRKAQLDPTESSRHRRLVSESLQRLDHCHAEFEEVENAHNHRLVLMTYYSARCFVNFVWIKSVTKGDNERLQKKTKDATLEEAAEVLVHVSQWIPKEDLGSLPTWHLSLIVFATSVIRDLITEGLSISSEVQDAVQLCIDAFGLSTVKSPSVEAIIQNLRCIV